MLLSRLRATCDAGTEAKTLVAECIGTDSLAGLQHIDGIYLSIKIPLETRYVRASARTGACVRVYVCVCMCMCVYVRVRVCMCMRECDRE